MGSLEVWRAVGPIARSGGDKGTPLPSRPHPLSAFVSGLLSSGCWGFCTDPCIFRALTPILQMLGLSSSGTLHWKLPLAMGNCLTPGAAHPIS